MNQDKRDKDIGSTPIHLASVNIGHDKLDELLANGADPNVKDNRGRTPLHHAAFYGYVHNVNILLKAGADPNAQDNEGYTPLNAAYNGRRDHFVIKMLRVFGGKKTGWLKSMLYRSAQD